MAKSNTAKKSTAARTVVERRVLDPKLKELQGHFAEVTGGRKFDIGTKVEVLNVSINRYGSDQARITIDGEIAYINPKFLKKGKPLPAARLAELEAEREAGNAPIMAHGRVVRTTEGDGGDNPGAVLFDTTGWFKPVWFSKNDFAIVHKFMDGDNEGTIIAEVPTWKVRSGAGADALAALEARQTAIAKMIPAKRK